MSILGIEVPRKVLGYNQLASGDITTARSIPGAGSVVLMQAEGQNIRYRLDGVDPTATEGHLLLVNSTVTINIGSGVVSDIKVIEAAVGGILNVTTFR